MATKFFIPWNHIQWTNFEEDLPRNIPAKFSPNWLSGLGGEDVYRNCWRRMTEDARRTQNHP